MNYTAFLEGTGKDDNRRRIKDVLRYGNARLECSHDYIQRVFPTAESSRFSDVEPITEEDLAALRQSDKAKENVRLMYQKMLSFWKIDGDRYKEWGNNALLRLWNRNNNHNQWRMTRVLKSLALLQMTEEYKDFTMRLSAILDLRENNRDIRITDETAAIWRENFYTGKEDE